MTLSESQKKTIELLNPWWNKKTVEIGIYRHKYLAQIERAVEYRRQILFILGSRRIGKTKILMQFINRLINQGIKPEQILFLSLDNSNLDSFDLYNFVTSSKFKYIILDEVHQFNNWAKILKSLYDLPNNELKIICSGSSSKLIEDDKAFLTGRNTQLHIYPLDYQEFVEFTKNDEVDSYIFYGGYPEYVLEKEPNYLNDLLRDIIEKDIVKVHKVKNIQYLFDVVRILSKQVGYKTSANKMSKTLGVDAKTVDNYLSYLKEVRLIDCIYQYSESINKKLFSPKKYYFSDLGMRNSFTGFSDKGSLVENAIFLRLVKVFGSNNIYYLVNPRGEEIDFVVSLGEGKIILIESKYINLYQSIENSLSNLIFKDVYGKKIIERLVVTDDVEAEIQKKGVKVKLISLKKLLSDDEFLENLRSG